MTHEIEIEIDEALDIEIEVDREDLRKAAIETLEYAQVQSGAVTVVITDNESVRGFNLQYREIDAPTDILSFAAQTEDSLDDLPPELLEEMGNYLGDLIIAYPYTVEQARLYHNPLDAELRLLVVHGTLHLLGYDHDTPERQAAMWQAQATILQRLGDHTTNWEREYDA
jgi:probable rRNA maturation factor